MSTQCMFLLRMWKIIPKLSSNTLLFCSTVIRVFLGAYMWFCRLCCALAQMGMICKVTTLHNLFLTTKWATSQENLSSGVCKLVWIKPACSAWAARYNVEILHLACIGITLSKQRTIKVLFRLHRWAGWFASLFAYSVKQVFSWLGSNLCDRKKVL